MPGSLPQKLSGKKCLALGTNTRRGRRLPSLMVLAPSVFSLPRPFGPGSFSIGPPGQMGFEVISGFAAECGDGRKGPLEQVRSPSIKQETLRQPPRTISRHCLEEGALSAARVRPNLFNSSPNRGPPERLVETPFRLREGRPRSRPGREDRPLNDCQTATRAPANGPTRTYGRAGWRVF